jgi:hypothetical protein
MDQAGISLDPHETLCIPKRRRFMHEYLSTADGNRELLIHFGTKEITFDEADYIPFGCCRRCRRAESRWPRSRSSRW